MLALPGNELTANHIARQIHASMGLLELRHFPDGETYVKVNTDVKGKDVIIVCTLARPDNHFLPLYFTAKTVKDLGARNIILVSPYLAYMRQDKRFQPGEGITSAYFASLLSDFLDGLVTIDPHLHRRSSLNEIYSIPTEVAHAADHISEWIKDHVSKPVLIGPDAESEQWVSDVARQAECPYMVLTKTRYGDRDVVISNPEVLEYEGFTPVLVDDIISTAGTMMETVALLKQTPMKPPVCIGVHAVFAGNAYIDLSKSGVSVVVTCNTILHETNRIDITDLLSNGVLNILKKKIV